MLLLHSTNPPRRLAIPALRDEACAVPLIRRLQRLLVPTVALPPNGMYQRRTECRAECRTGLPGHCESSRPGHAVSCLSRSRRHSASWLVARTNYKQALNPLATASSRRRSPPPHLCQPGRALARTDCMPCLRTTPHHRFIDSGMDDEPCLTTNSIPKTISAAPPGHPPTLHSSPSRSLAQSAASQTSLASFAASTTAPSF